MNVGACTFLRELTIIGSLSINLLNNFTENKQGKEIPENSNPMSSEPVQICWSSQSIIFVSFCNTIFESESCYSLYFGHTLKYPSVGSQYLKSTAYHSFLNNCWEQWILEICSSWTWILSLVGGALILDHFCLSSSSSWFGLVMLQGRTNSSDEIEITWKLLKY